MKSSNSVKAFTLLELIVVMLISGIVFTLAGGVYLTWLKTYNKWHSKTESEQTFYLLNNRLSNEMDQCWVAKGVGNELFLTFKDREAVNYTFDNKMILRRCDLATDTFKFNIITSSFRTFEVDGDELVDEISLSLVINIDTFNLNVNKRYSNETLFNLANNGHSDK